MTLANRRDFTPSDEDAVFGRDLKVGGHAALSVAAAVTAAGTNLATATSVTADINLVTTAASGTGVALDAATPVGGTQVVQNLGANNLEVYPPSSAGIINGASAGGSITLAAATDDVGRFIRVSATQWIGTVSAGPAT